jgi:hypothetical protein
LNHERSAKRPGEDGRGELNLQEALRRERQESEQSKQKDEPLERRADLLEERERPFGRRRRSGLNLPGLTAANRLAQAVEQPWRAPPPPHEHEHRQKQLSERKREIPHRATASGGSAKRGDEQASQHEVVVQDDPDLTKLRSGLVQTGRAEAGDRLPMGRCQQRQKRQAILIQAQHVLVQLGGALAAETRLSLRECCRGAVDVFACGFDRSLVDVHGQNRELVFSGTRHFGLCGERGSGAGQIRSRGA